MKYALLTILIFGCLLLAGIVAVAKATEPATIYYTTGGIEIIEQRDFVCPEHARLWKMDYSKIASDGSVCFRWRPYVCLEPDEHGELIEDVVVEHLPLSFCPVR